MEEIFGFIESILFADEGSGFTVAKLKEPKKQELTCIVGTLPTVRPGETLRCQGKWVMHPKHGQQFEVTSFESQAPSDLIGIQKYLESGMIKGIGPAYAARIVKQFGTETLKVIDESPDRLMEIPGLGMKRIDQIKQCWKDQYAIRSVMIFLNGHGVSPAFAQKIYKTYGDACIERLKTNPYDLAKDVFGIGFKSADKIAQGLGIATDHPARIDSGIEYILWELSNEGHVCSLRSILIEAAKAALDVPAEKIEARIELLKKEEAIFQEEDLIWIRPLYLSEVNIARELSRLISQPCSLREVVLDKAIDWVEEQLNISFAEEQKNAIEQALKEKLLIVTGGPGTGKSTITRALLAILGKLTTKILLAAPTGRAAKRLSEITGKKAFTIHSLLEMDFASGTFKKNRENPLVCDLMIIDEASMIDTLLMNHLLKAIPSSARIIFVGDIDQLPSVGPGNVLKDMINAQRLPVCTLKEIFRQAKHSQIVINAHRINAGEFPFLTSDFPTDFLFFDSQTPEGILEILLDLVTNILPKKHRFHKFEDIQVLSPMKKGIVGIENLNTILQQSLNPNPNPLLRMGRKFHRGDKVMQIRNNYQKEVYNGDVGCIVEMDLEEQSLKVAFDGKIVPYDFAEIDELMLAYAVSIHKYQGSECPCVIIPLHLSHFKLLNRNLLYTAITRGKKLVILIGSKKAIAIAVKNDEIKQRHTGLKKRIEEYGQMLST